MDLPFGYVYDDRMLLHKCHYDNTMAERPERMSLIFERLLHDKLLIGSLKIESRPATDEELLINHPRELLSELQDLKTSDDCEEYCRDKEILWLSPESEQAARLAVGSSIDIVKANIDKKIGNGFAIVRPPGHHSYGKISQGYCVFNNVAIAAKVALKDFGVKKIAIVDFDYHAGNGTFYSVKNEENIMFVSLHSYCHAAFWPFMKEFDFDTGKNTIFFPLNGAMNTEVDFMAAFHHVILPILKEWAPELILVSAGFDAGFYDIMLEMGQAVKAHGFGHIVRCLNEITPDHVIAILEGGYFPRNYTESAAMMVRGLKGLKLPKIDYSIPVAGPMIETIWNNVIHHKKHFNCMELKERLLQAQQEKVGLLPFMPKTQIYLGGEMRRMYDKVKKRKAVRTREWFPELSPEAVAKSTKKIDEYIHKYKYEEKPEKYFCDLNVKLEQLLWTEQTEADYFIRSAETTLFFVNDFRDFVEGILIRIAETIQVLQAEKTIR
ncbi:unnamed protein product [Auanema sp. JU1783]|nr:unnamed protein product [Auanema sp. JU1783]